MSKASQLRQKALEHLKKGRLEKAIEEYTRLVSVDSRNPNVYNELGDIYLKAGDRVQAVSSFEKASAHYEKVALYNNSIAVCKKILRVVPNRLDTIFKLGELKAKQHFAAEAENFFVQYMNGVLEESQPTQPAVQERVETMLELVPDSEDVAATAADLLERIGLRSDAAKLLAGLVKRFRAAGDGDRAANHLERFNAIAEGLGTADRALVDAELVEDAESDGTAGAAPGAAAAEPPAAAVATEEPAPVSGETPGAGEAEPRKQAAPAAAPETSSPVPEPGVTEIPDPAAVFDEPAGGETRERPAETVFEIPAGEGGPEIPATGTAAVESKETVYDIPAGGGAEETPAAGTPEPAGAVHDIPAQEDGAPETLDDILGEIDENAPPASSTETLVEEITSDVEEDDHKSHYDLGMAYLEMALYNEAIKEFQAASRSIQLQARCLEMIGHSFIQLGNPRLAVKQLERGLAEAEKNGGDTLGINYNLGLAWEMLGELDKARDHFEEVYIVDVAFRDVGDKMKKLSTVS